MASFLGVIVDSGQKGVYDELRSLQVKIDREIQKESLLVQVSWMPIKRLLNPWTEPLNQAERFARQISKSAVSCFVVYATPSVDEYSISHFRNGEIVRKIAFHGEMESPWELEGQSQSWESDLLFALPAEDFIAYLSDDSSFSEADLDLARKAHAACRVDLMPRRPPLLEASLWAWLHNKVGDPWAPDGWLRV
jgi:hypothetical protein